MDYLSALRPAVVHRDVKPENIVIEGGKWGGRVFLVDFGGVQVQRQMKYIVHEGGVQVQR